MTTHYTATYSPEDNKLRLYASTRLDAETYARVRAAGFIWAPKQELFVAPQWTPAREDLCIELAGEIDDEDKSLVDRSEERAERFEDYSDKRLNDAESARAAVTRIADGIPLGQPILIGHHSERHARKDAKRIEDGMRKTVRMWETSKYWTERAAGAIQHAKYKERPDVRARRIKGLESDARKFDKELAKAGKLLKFWSLPNITREQALHVANYFDQSGSWNDLHPERGNKPVEEVAARRREGLPKVIAHWQCWLDHTNNRLAYERAMLGEVGGLEADKVKPEKGGAVQCWVKRGVWLEIQKVNKVTVSVLDNWGNGGRDFMRTVPFDKLSGVMSRADFEAFKSGGNNPAEGREIRHATFEKETPSELEQAIRDMKASLKTGVQITVAPQLFPTPCEVAERMADLAIIEPGHEVLEPSAGTGRLVGAMGGRMFGHNPERGRVVAIEINEKLAQCLRVEYPLTDVKAADFLQCNGDLGKFDRVLMNPPFADGADIKHILHAREFLKPGGRIVAICANGPRQERALQSIATSWEELPTDTFKEQGTSVRTVLLTIDA